MSRRPGILRPLGMALVLALGFGVVFGLVVGWGISIWEGLSRKAINEALVVRADGTPLIQHYEYDEYQQVTFRTLDGKEVPAPKQQENWLVGASLTLPRR